MFRSACHIVDSELMRKFGLGNAAKVELQEILSPQSYQQGRRAHDITCRCAIHLLICLCLFSKNVKDNRNPFSDISHRALDHCIELLRQTALCHADASLTTFVWHPKKQRPMFNASESTHKCIDWSILMASVADRVVSEEEILRLKNPLIQPKNAF